MSNKRKVMLGLAFILASLASYHLYGVLNPQQKLKAAQMAGAINRMASDASISDADKIKNLPNAVILKTLGQSPDLTSAINNVLATVDEAKIKADPQAEAKVNDLVKLNLPISAQAKALKKKMKKPALTKGQLRTKLGTTTLGTRTKGRALPAKDSALDYFNRAETERKKIKKAQTDLAALLPKLKIANDATHPNAKNNYDAFIGSADYTLLSTAADLKKADKLDALKVKLNAVDAKRKSLAKSTSGAPAAAAMDHTDAALEKEAEDIKNEIKAEYDRLMAITPAGLGTKWAANNTADWKDFMAYAGSLPKKLTKGELRTHLAGVLGKKHKAGTALPVGPNSAFDYYQKAVTLRKSIRGYQKALAALVGTLKTEDITTPDPTVKTNYDAFIASSDYTLLSAAAKLGGKKTTTSELPTLKAELDAVEVKRRALAKTTAVGGGGAAAMDATDAALEKEANDIKTKIKAEYDRLLAISPTGLHGKWTGNNTADWTSFMTYASSLPKNLTANEAAVLAIYTTDVQPHLAGLEGSLKTYAKIYDDMFKATGTLANKWLGTPGDAESSAKFQKDNGTLIAELKDLGNETTRSELFAKFDNLTTDMAALDTNLKKGPVVYEFTATLNPPGGDVKDVATAAAYTKSFNDNFKKPIDEIVTKDLAVQALVAAAEKLYLKADACKKAWTDAIGTAATAWNDHTGNNVAGTLENKKNALNAMKAHYDGLANTADGADAAKPFTAKLKAVSEYKALTKIVTDFGTVKADLDAADDTNAASITTANGLLGVGKDLEALTQSIENFDANAANEAFKKALEVEAKVNLTQEMIDELWNLEIDMPQSDGSTKKVKVFKQKASDRPAVGSDFAIANVKAKVDKVEIGKGTDLTGAQKNAAKKAAAIAIANAFKGLVKIPAPIAEKFKNELLDAKNNFAI